MRVCVVGAGISGLTAIKHCKEYGLDVVCYEGGRHIGGLWRYNEGDREGFGSVMRNTILNTSKEFITLSDFPMPENVPNFPHNREVFKYFEDYAEYFGLKEQIVFETRVKEIKRADDYDSSGNWVVVTENSSGTQTSIFNAVMVCNGHHVRPAWPNIPGLKEFQGTLIHSHDYKDHRPFHDRRILVVGFGNSGGDVACELARVAKQVFVSTRHGTWVTRRVVQDGYPRDVILRNRYFERLQKNLPAAVRRFLTLKEYTTFFDHGKYGLRPEELPGESPVLLADDLPLHLSSGAVKIRKGIEKIDGSIVCFEDGSREEVDDIIVCTGYDFDFKFIENGDLVPVEDNQVRLYRRIFAPKEKHHTLAIIGLVDPLGPTITMVEMQSRAVTHIWALGVAQPGQREMEMAIDDEKAATAARFKCSARKASLQVYLPQLFLNSYQIDYVSYMDALAGIIGCVPPLDIGYFVWNAKLGFLLNFGPVTASHYRIHGPHAWSKAEEHISKTFDRVHKAMGPSATDVRDVPYSLLLLNTPATILLCALAIWACILMSILF